MCCCIAVSIVISTVKQQNCNIGVLLYLWTNVKTTLLLAYLFHLRFCTAVCMLHFCRAMLCKRGLYAVTRCPSVCLSDCLSVRPSRLWILPKRVTMSSIFSPSGSQTILVFPYQTAWQYSDGNPPNGGVESWWGRQKSRFWANIWFHHVLWTLGAAGALHSAATDHGELMTVAGKRRNLLMAGDDDEVYDKKPQRYAEDNR